MSPPKSVIKALWFPCDCEIIAEYSVLNGSALDKLQRTFAWGVDIAGSLADAGGVGALLQFANSTTGTAFMPSYDGNGNIASLINLGSGALAGAFEYSPFGEMLRDEILDNTVATFAFRFSTKWRDAETGWSNYGRRYYDPRNGRFIGRDPISEKGGINLYGFIGNNPICRWDFLGLEDPVVTLPPFIVSATRPRSRIDIWKEYQRLAPYLLDEDLWRMYEFDGVVPQDIQATIDEALGLRRLTDEELAGNGEIGLYYFRWNGQSWDAYSATNVQTKYAFVNGITGTLGRHADLAVSHITSSFGLVEGSTLTEFTLFNNPTSGNGVLGTIGDIGEATLDKLGFTTPVAKALAAVLWENQVVGHQTTWIAHSQGGAIFSEAMNYAAANGATNLSVNTVQFNAGANNWLMTNSIAESIGVTVTGYYGSPFDSVPNFVGLNGNLATISMSLVLTPMLFVGDLSPHTEPQSDWYLLHPGTGAMGPFPPLMGPFPPR